MSRRPTIPPAPWDGLDLDRLNPIQRRVFDAAYALGYMHGIDRGRQQADDEAAVHWRGVAEHVRRNAGHPTYDELEKRRRSVPVTPFPSRQQCRDSWGLPETARRDAS